MPLWKITDSGPKQIKETRFKAEKMLEENLEEWIAADPLLLGEPLLILGRQVLVPDTKDRLDLLAVDPRGQVVIIELKRGDLKDPVDIQALRYASYISKWRFEDFENVARNYLKKVGDLEFNLNAYYELFCEESGVDEAGNLNEDQRIILVGSAVRDKLGSVALWLRDHNVDIKLIEMRAYKEGENIIIEPSVIVPVQVSKFKDVGTGRREDTPWMTDGKVWHLEKRSSPKTKELFFSLDSLIQEHLEVDGPNWKQKYYVAYRINNYNWLCVHTKPKFLLLDFYLKAKSFKTSEIAEKLNIVEFDKEETLSEKLSTPSSVFIKNIRENMDRVRIRVKEDFNLASGEFLQFLEKAYKAFPK
jgi:hypothetical protein